MNSHDQYQAFCDELKDSLAIFKVWESVREGKLLEGDLLDTFKNRVTTLMRLAGSSGTEPKPRESKPTRSKQQPNASSGVTVPKKDIILKVMSELGPGRSISCSNITTGYMQALSEEQRPAKDQAYTIVHNTLTAMQKQRLVDRTKDKQTGGVMWFLTETGKAHIVEVSR